MGDAFELRTFVGSFVETDGLHFAIELLGAALHRPLWLEGRKRTSDLVAIYPVAPFVGASVRSIFDLASRNGLGDNVGDFRYTEVFLGSADIEGLIVNHRDGRFKDR